MKNSAKIDTMYMLDIALGVWVAFLKQPDALPGRAFLPASQDAGNRIAFPSSFSF
jgi:hypothetical protein